MPKGHFAVCCGAEIWRCPTCHNAVSQGRVTKQQHCPNHPDSPAVRDSREHPAFDCDKHPGGCIKGVLAPATRCRKHGGNAPHVKAAVIQRRQRQGAERLVARLAIPADDQNPVETLLNQLRLTRGMVDMLTELVADLDGTVTRMAWDPDAGRLGHADSDGIAGATYHQSGIPTGEAKPHVFVQMLKDWSADLNRLLIDCAKLGIEERRLASTERIEQAQIDRLFGAVTSALTALPSEHAQAFKDALAAALREQPPELPA